MEKTRIICVRFPESLLQRIDHLKGSSYGSKRSRVIISLLENLTTCADEVTLRRMIHTWDAYSSGYVVNFTKPQK